MQILMFTALDLCRVFLGIPFPVVLLPSLAQYTCISLLPHCHIAPRKAQNGGGFEQRGGGKAAGKRSVEMAEDKECEWLEITITAWLRLEGTLEVILPEPLLKQSQPELLPRNVS